ncbi:MAG TPA: ABC transporter ATP-binding protein [Actinocrinis sp.]|nr:ABC transporter ATP-binding protein [Actinocrinis sp.]
MNLQPADNGPALVAQNLTKRFGERTAFADVSFSVEHGEVFGFLGPNGAGKTTTVRTLAAMIVPSSGMASVAGLPLVPQNAVAIRSRIAVMPESPGLYLRLSVAENLAYFAGLYELPDRQARIDRALKAVGLQQRANELCRSLSKGLRQRVALARVLLTDPKVLFLDEPTSGLDPLAAHEVHELIDALRRQGVTIFLTTHRLAEAEALCDRVGILNTTLRMLGRPDELREQLFSKSIELRVREPLPDPERVFGALPGVEGWRRAQDDGAYVLTVSDAEIAAPAAARALVGTGADLLALSPTRHTLEDVYLQLIDTDVEAQQR